MKTFPTCYKTAKINPIYKKGSKTEIHNHRPIAVLSNFSKVFEALIHERLKSFLKTNALLSDNQYGFRSERNTELAAMKLVERILPALSNKSYGIAVF